MPGRPKLPTSQHHQAALPRPQDEMLELLKKWQLPELYPVFRGNITLNYHHFCITYSKLSIISSDNKITVRSFNFLSDEDINSLIPQVGTRAVFNAMLSDWRKQGGDSGSSMEMKRTHEQAFESDSNRSDVFAEPSIIKAEMDLDQLAEDTYWMQESESTKDSVAAVQDNLNASSNVDRQSIDQRSEGERSMDEQEPGEGSMVSLQKLLPTIFEECSINKNKKAALCDFCYVAHFSTETLNISSST